MPPKRSKLIAIEGIDQSGKRTQSRLLALRLRTLHYPVEIRDFPDYTTPVGKQLKGYLGGRHHFDYHAAHLLYAANKWELADTLRRELSRGKSLIVNRYTSSNLAYGIAHGLPLEWLLNLEDGLPTPDIVLILDISPSISFRRKRRYRDRHESDRCYLVKVRNSYKRLAKKYKWQIVNGERAAEIVEDDIWRLVSRIY